MASEELVLEVTAKLDQALRDVQNLQKQLDALATGTETTVTANVQGKEDVEALAASTAELDGSQASVTVDAEDNATEILDEAQGAVDDLDGAEAEVELEADDNATDVVEDAQSAVDNLDGSTAEVEIQVEGGEEAGAEIESIGAGLLALGPAALGGVAAAGLGQVALKSAEATLSIKALADATGASLEDASGLAEQFDFIGVSSDKLLTMVGRVADQIGATPELASKLGVDAALPPLELFIATVDALNSSQLSANDKMRLGIDLFGRRGLAAVQGIGTQIGDLSDAVDNIPDFQVVTEDDVQSAIEMKEAMDQIGDAIAEVAQKAVTVLGPAIEGIKIALAELPTVNIPAVNLGNVFTGAFDRSAIEGYLNDLATSEAVVRELTAAIEANKISHQEWNSMIADGSITMEEAAAAGEHGAAAAEKLSGAWGHVPAEVDAATTSTRDYIDAAAEVAGVVDQITSGFDGFQRSTTRINADLDTQAAKLRIQDTLWGAVLADLTDEDGIIGTADGAVDAYGQLQDILHLNNVEMAALVNQKVAEKLEADAKAALEFAEALGEVKQTIADINLDDVANMASGLEEALGAGSEFITHLSFAENLQHEFDDALSEAEKFGPDLRELLDLQAAGIEITPDITLGELESDDAEFLAWVSSLQNMIQGGAVEAFKTGGTDAANEFVQAQAAAIAASTGLDIAEVYRLMGLPPDGTVDMLLKPIVDAESKADALAILDGLIGVDPNNPMLAYIRLQVQAGTIDGVQAEIMALLLAQQYGIDVTPQLAEFTPEQIAAAEAALAGNPVTIPTAADPTGATDDIAEVEGGDYQATIEALAETQAAARQLLDETTRQRQATIYAIASITSAKIALDSLRERRDASILAVAYTAGAEYELNHTARRRDSYIYQHVVPTGGGGGGGGGPTGGTLLAPAALGVAPLADGEEDVGVAPLAAPAMSSVSSSGVAIVGAAPASITNNLQVTVQAAVIGNRHEVERTVAKALRSYTRLNGSRN